MGQKKNICRPITFYNDYIPVAESGSKTEAEFCAFGIVDEIQVGEILSCGDGEESRSITDQIWEAQKLFNGKGEGKYSAQRVYAVCWEEEEEERAFWEEEGDVLPFFFFCRIQCGYNKLLLMQDRSVIEKKKTDFGNDIKIKTYLTYDNTDLFVVIRASRYSTGAEVVDGLHQGMDFTGQENREYVLKNSFTIMAVQYKWIERLSAGEFGDWSREEKIENVYIRLIEREGGNIGEVLELIRSRTQGVKSVRRTVLGTDDEMIILSDIGWRDFLSLYDKNEGVFGDRFNKDSIYNRNAAGVTTQICIPLKEKNKKKTECREEDKLSNTFSRQIKELRKKLNRINGIYPNYIDELNIILNALPKYSGEMFNDYVFFPLLKVLDTLLDLMIKEMDLWQQPFDKAPFYDFLTGFCFYTQSTMLTDRHTVQMPGFNVKIYDIPVKLNAFYNAYMYRITSILKIPVSEKTGDNNEVSYDFIAMPGMADFVKVGELYKDFSNTQRLMKVEIPEYSFYNIRNMMVILAHETAHYVGRGLRNREDRSEIIISSYAHIYVKYIEKVCGLEGYEKEIWEEIEGRLVNLIYRSVFLEFDKKFLEKERYGRAHELGCSHPANRRKTYRKSDYGEVAEKKKKNIDYFTELLPCIHVAMTEIVENNLGIVFAPMMPEENNCREASSVVKDASWRFIIVASEDTVVSSQAVLDSLKALYEESFADLMAVMVLKIGMEEYITGIIDGAEYQNLNLDALVNSEAILRIAAVLGCIVGSRDLVIPDCADGFVGDEWRTEMQKSNGERWTKVAQAAMGLWYEERILKYSNKPYEDNIYCALVYDGVILEYAAKYLKSCMKRFAENYRDNFRKRTEEIRNVFQLFSVMEGASGEEQIRKMVSFIEDYKWDLLQEMAKEGNDDGFSGEI